MKKGIVALLLLLGVAATASLVFAATEELGSGAEGLKLTSTKMQGLTTHAAKLRSSAVVGDTTYVGYTPGTFNAATNWWSVGAGYSPAGTNSPAYRRPPNRGGMWDFEPTTGVPWSGDSLMGWWPDRMRYGSTGGQTRPDWNRPWWAVEQGNHANYMINGISGRTYGVVGVWHRDDAGVAVAAPGYAFRNATGAAPTWAPIGGPGTFSAWMGLRAHNDVRFQDPITKSHFNQDVLRYAVWGSTDPTGCDDRFPGYGSQMDQMLYKDINMALYTNNDLTVTYSYRVTMSTGFGTTVTTRTGWFDKDPLQVTGGGTTNQGIGNFISSTDAGAAAPRDSFMVYVGAPAEGSFLASDGNTYPIYDPQRRWFAEVLRANEGLYKEIESVSGLGGSVVTQSFTIPKATLAPWLAASGGKVRLCFRVHTNVGFDDQGTSYNSGGAGAAQLDNVQYTIVGGPASGATWGHFEEPLAIDNSLIVDAKDAWKSTGKPPGIVMHVHDLATLQYDDLCGQPGDASRVCNLTGTVISMGDHDNSEAAGGLIDGTMDRERRDWIWSPTIQLCSDAGLVWPNAIGLKNPALGGAQDGYAGEEYYLDTDIYMGIFDPYSKGNLWQFAVMAYPAKDRNNNEVWSNYRMPGYIIFNPDQQCVRDFGDHNVKGNSLLAWSKTMSQNATFPDSVRFTIGKMQYCFRFGVSTGCSPTDGAYLDNLSFMIVDGEPAPVACEIWDLYQDVFPWNETTGLPAYAVKFDTCGALVKTGINISPQEGLARLDVPGDSCVVVSSPSVGKTRVDLIFRVLPGPGNYVTIGRPDISTLIKYPDAPSALHPLPRASYAINNAGVPGSDNFWESYITDNGPYGSKVYAQNPHQYKGAWDANGWNSARLDTVEASGLFSYQNRAVLGGPADNNTWFTALHETELGLPPDPLTVGTDPWYAIHNSARVGLGIVRNRCFVAASGASLSDIDCVHVPPQAGAGYDLSYISATGGANPATGYSGSGTTVEGTKIIPDGLLTPGASVQYFFRKEDSNAIGVLAGTMPDTTNVFPQNQEGSNDAHRWQYFAVLPDRWKSASYLHPVYNVYGIKEACLLVVDNNDRRGDERAWIGVADTIGATSLIKYGAHNGWFAPGTGTDAVNLDASRVYVNGGSPGTTWDFYNVKASESLTTGGGSIGARLAVRDPSNPQLNDKNAKGAPTPDMLAAFYTCIYLFSGDLNAGVMGPYSQRTQDDVSILTNYLQGGDMTAQRGFWGMGDGFVEANWNEGPASPQDNFNLGVLGVNLRSNSYTLISGNTESTPDMIALPPVASPPAAADIFGMQNRCLWTNDVLERSPGLSAETQDAAKYEDFGVGTPFLSGVNKLAVGARPWIAMTDGWDILHLRTRFDVNTRGRHRYMYEVFTHIFKNFCHAWGTPIISVDVPTFGDAEEFVNFVQLRNTPLVKGQAKVHLGLAKSDWVKVKVFDVSGRLVRTLADRQFTPGEHDLLWDGSDDAGRQVARGVYFTQVSYRNSNFTAARKLTVLK